jgi:hypothetical protein
MSMATVASALQGQQAHHHLMLLPSSQADDVDMDTDTVADEASGFIPDIKSPHLKMFSDDTAADNPLGCMLSSLGASPSGFNGDRFSPLGLGGPSDVTMGFSPGGPASMSATALLQKAAQMGATTRSGYGPNSVSFTHTGFGSTMAGLDRPNILGPFGPIRAYDRLPQDGTQLVGFDVGGLMPGQLYNEGAHNVRTTTTIGSVMSGGNKTNEQRRVEDMQVVDYMGVQHQRTFGNVSPFVDHMSPWT